MAAGTYEIPRIYAARARRLEIPFLEAHDIAGKDRKRGIEVDPLPSLAIRHHEHLAQVRLVAGAAREREERRQRHSRLVRHGPGLTNRADDRDRRWRAQPDIDTAAVLALDELGDLVERQPGDLRFALARQRRG